VCLSVNLEAGIGAGVAAALLNFVLAFSSASQFIRKRERVHSAVTRSLRSRRYLSGRQGEVCCFELSGFLFFGSTLQIKNVVSSAVQIEIVAATAAAGPAGEPSDEEQGRFPPHAADAPGFDQALGRPLLSDDQLSSSSASLFCPTATLCHSLHAQSLFRRSADLYRRGPHDRVAGRVRHQDAAQRVRSVTLHLMNSF
jgi:MFS superfamily sulfate permease-like transporter